MAKQTQQASVLNSLGFKLFLTFNSVFLIACMAIAVFSESLGYKEMAYIVLFFSISFVRAPFVRKEKAQVNTVVEDRREAVSVAVLGLGQNILPGLFLATGLLSFADRDWPLWTLAIGAAFAALGLFTLRRAHTDLDTNWSGVLEIRDGQKLITHGVYGLVRHPIYLAFFLNNIAVFFLLDNWIAGAAGFLAFLFMYSRRVPVEEGMMAKEFGAEWDAFAAKTPRVIPNPFRSKG